MFERMERASFFSLVLDRLNMLVECDRYNASHHSIMQSHQNKTAMHIIEANTR